jgi:hypothetical protein
MACKRESRFTEVQILISCATGGAIIQRVLQPVPTLSWKF